MKESEVQTILHRLSEFKTYYNLMNENSDISFNLSKLSGLDSDLARLKEFVIDEKRFDLAPGLARYREMFLYSLTKFNLNTAATRLFETSYEQLKIIDEWCKKEAGIPEENFDDYAYTDNGFKCINDKFDKFIELEFCVDEQDKLPNFVKFDFNTGKQDEVYNKNYSQKLRDLFNGHTDLIDALCGLSDDEIIDKLSEWRKKTDKYGKPLIENPCNRRRKIYGDELVKAGIGESAEKIRKGIR